MRRGQKRLLEAAVRIGEALCGAAYWHEGRCNWVGRSVREMVEPGLPLVPTVTALGPELYGGTAGIALFLAELFVRTGGDRTRRTAEGAIRQALRQGEALPSAVAGSFYSGQVGIGFAAVQAGALLGRDEIGREGIALLRRGLAPASPDRALDVIGGHAGAIAPLLRLGFRDLALGLAKELADAAVKRDGVWCWEPERASGKGIGTTPLCGFGHGASGMGLALLEAGVAAGREEWVRGGLAAFAYEDRLYDGERQNWPDLREFGGPAPASRSFMVAWCHGAAGIGLARLRALQLMPEREAELLTGVERAIRGTEAALERLPAEADASPCHGRAGLAEVLLYASEVLGEAGYADRAREMWLRVLRARGAEAEWPCGVASGRGNPSLMLGYAGVGYGLLRAGDPGGVASVLVVHPITNGTK